MFAPAAGFVELLTTCDTPEVVTAITTIIASAPISTITRMAQSTFV
jgi:hypothetical protein